MGQEGRDVADTAMMEGAEDEQLETHCRIWTYGSRSHGMKLIGAMSSRGKPTKGRWVPNAHTKHRRKKVIRIKSRQGNTDKAVRNLMHVCDGNVGVKAIMTKQQVIEVVHSQNAMAVITISFSRGCYTVNMGRAEFAISHRGTASTMKQHRDKCARCLYTWQWTLFTH